MFKSKELIYIQLQKTGCTHIASLLSKLFEGKIIGSHNAATPKLIKSGRFFISSIRNPWDWYLSLWTFGCQGRGSLWRHLAKRANPLQVLKAQRRNPFKVIQACFDEMTRDVEKWRRVYDKASDVTSYRKWLKMIHSSGNSRYLGEGYSDTTITGQCGFMTYRYLYLCCRDPRQLKMPDVISCYEELVNFNKKNCYIDYFVRQEALEDSLFEAIELVRPLTERDRDVILSAKKTNTSERPFSIQDYYDQESIDLIGNRDRLIIDKFNYIAPHKYINSRTKLCRRRLTPRLTFNDRC